MRRYVCVPGPVGSKVCVVDTKHVVRIFLTLYVSTIIYVRVVKVWSTTAMGARTPALTNFSQNTSHEDDDILAILLLAKSKTVSDTTANQPKCGVRQLYLAWRRRVRRGVGGVERGEN